MVLFLILSLFVSIDCPHPSIDYLPPVHLGVEVNVGILLTDMDEVLLAAEVTASVLPDSHLWRLLPWVAPVEFQAITAAIRRDQFDFSGRGGLDQAMLTSLYVEALLTDSRLADQVWELWNAGDRRLRWAG